MLSITKKVLWASLLFWAISHPARADKINATNVLAIAIPVTGAVYSLSIEDYEGFKQLLYTTGTSVHLTAFLKHAIDSKRPEGDSLQSFPSGHTSSAFFGASFLHLRYGWRWGVPAYALASVIGLHRLNVNAHRFRDVAAGAALGFFSAYLYTQRYEAPPKLTVQPWARSSSKFQSLGLQFTYQF